MFWLLLELYVIIEKKIYELKVLQIKDDKYNGNYSYEVLIIVILSTSFHMAHEALLQK